MRNGGLLSSQLKRARVATATLGLLFATSGCLTNFGSAGRFSTGGGTEEIEQSNPFAGGSANSALITLSRVVKSTSAPRANLDLHGDGSGSLGNYCVTAGGGGASPDGPSTCACNYSYIRSDGNPEAFDVDTIYREDNMIRCPYTSVPADVTQMRVKIHLTSVDAFSNEIVFRFTGGAGALNVTDSASFLRVQRYQCKQALYIPNPFDAKVIDPFMSEDNAFAFLGNFYTTNMGLAIARFVDPARGISYGDASHTEAGWICPTAPNDSSFGADLTLYSVAPDSTGNYKLYPPTDPSTDRTTFYLAKEPTGVFTVPFQSFSVPQEPTGSTIGYGASPIRSTVDGEESCPASNAPIPSGYKWVKVWAFRGTVVDRTYYTSSHFNGIRGIACNPGLWDKQTTGGSTFREPVFPACGSPNNQAPGRNVAAHNTGCESLLSATMPVSNGSQIADRVLWPFSGNNEAAQCAKVNPGGTTNSSSELGDQYGVLSLGSDTWRRYYKTHPIPDNDTAPTDFSTCDRYSITGSGNAWMGIDDSPVTPDDCSQPYNIFNLCPGSTLGTENLLSNPQTSRPAPLSEASPNWSAPWAEADGQTILDGTRYTDIVYVVTEPNIMTRHMMEESESGIGARYRPFRFYSGADCSSNNPFSPGLRPDGTPDCPINRRIHYEFINRDNTQSDPEQSGDDPNLVRGYPICALQPL